MVLLIILLVIGICLYFYVSDSEKARKKAAQEVALMRQTNQKHLNAAAQKAAESGVKIGSTITGPGFGWSFSVDKASKQFVLCFGGTDTPNIYRFSDLIAWDVYENGNSIVSGDTGAALGAGLLFGAVGAIAASAGSREVKKTCNQLSVDLVLNDTVKIRQPLPLITDETPCDSPEYKRAAERAKNITAELAYIKANAAPPQQPDPQPPKLESPQPSESSEPDIYAQIEKLHALKEKGIITDQEFQKKKQSLLGL